MTFIELNHTENNSDYNWIKAFGLDMNMLPKTSKMFVQPEHIIWFGLQTFPDGSTATAVKLADDDNVTYVTETVEEIRDLLK